MQYDEKDLYKEDLDEDRPAPRQRHPVLLLLCGLLLAAVWGAWTLHRMAVDRRAAAAAARAAAAADVAAAAKAAGPGGAAAAAAATAPVPDPEAQPAPVPPAAGPGKRRFYGVVYDLANKKPLAAAQVILALGPPGATGVAATCPTDLNGHYTCDLSEAADQVSVSVSTEGYQGQFEDLIPPLRARSESQRRAVLAQRDDYLEPARVLFAVSQEVVLLDLVVVPKDWLPPAPKP
ncbi:MAG: carboxypeptidase-like regulatory domain-containing protein [Elusimicrobia bacterium]|nr:carboxypeptidase-like regulatory domain-containing protein [Elusimicrobiota bacterium]